MLHFTFGNSSCIIEFLSMWCYCYPTSLPRFNHLYLGVHFNQQSLFNLNILSVWTEFRSPNNFMLCAEKRKKNLCNLVLSALQTRYQCSQVIKDGCLFTAPWNVFVVIFNAEGHFCHKSNIKWQIIFFILIFYQLLMVGWFLTHLFL